MEQVKQLDYINQFPIKVGCYYMQRGSLVRVDKEVKPGWFSTEYVQISGADVSCGGGSSAWLASDYTPIVDEALIAAASVRGAQIRERMHCLLMQKAIQDQAEWRGAMQAMMIARAAITRATKGD